ncbi:hypothetical protein psal_cds_1188 [Pandoravirus salinus]|uniref:Uncharacterized protein n=1 Tax=Pandoravirus salinus TaxID=1349410 RepID=S4VYQ8_9VIRU|nr:hypothetical protein psal_cds_1188 [Pandoravirus salinus]AGO85473.1 hypothetical protein psal_cds_1188 [Pandoravirus salinus]
MRRSNQPPSARPAIARPPARPSTTARPRRAPQTWDDVRQWAADNGLDSAQALQRWLDATASPGQAAPVDPRAAALLQTLRQFSLATSPGQRLPATAMLPTIYGPFLEALSQPTPGLFRLTPDDQSAYPPGMDGPEWIRPLVDPLAEGGRLWPPSPVTALVRMNEIASRALGYGPVDADALTLDLADSDSLRDAVGAPIVVASMVNYFAKEIGSILRSMGDVRVDPAGPKLASDSDIAEARRRWPAVLPDQLEKPYAVIVGQGRARDHLGTWSPATGPVHVALLLTGSRVTGRLAVSDTTGEVVDNNGIFYLHRTGKYAPPEDARIVEASGGNPRLVVDLVMPFVRAMREGRPDAAALAPATGIAGSRFWGSGQSIEQPFMARAFEPAEVLAALLAQRRAAAVDAINEATASAGGLARMAAQAYRGDIATANVPEEVRELIAAQAVARACASGATAQDRARVDAAARVLGLPEAVRAQDLTTICEASVDAVRNL